MKTRGSFKQAQWDTLFQLILMFLVLGNCDFTWSQNKGPISAIEGRLTKQIRLAEDSVAYFSVPERMEALHIMGFSTAIVQNGKLVHTSTFGTKNNHGEAVDEHTLFQAASISKPITALAILKLVQEQKLRLDENVNTYLKEYQLVNPFEADGHIVTIRNILNHSAGLNVGGFGGYPNGTTVPKLLASLKGQGNSPALQVVEQPNTRWNYSGGGYLLLGKIIEDVSGLPFHIYLKQEILDPLGMTESTFQQPIDTSSYRNISYAYNASGKPYNGNWHNYAAQGAGGLWTTPTDLAKYCMGVYKAYTGKDNALFDQKTMEDMVIPNFRNWGLGPLIVEKPDGAVFTHDGSNAGFKADFFAYLTKGNAVIAMANSENGADLCAEYLEAASRYYGWKAREPLLVKSLPITLTMGKNYLGVYEWLDNSTYTIAITQKGRKLFLEYGDNGQLNSLELELMDAGNAINIETGQRLAFRMDTDGKVTGLLWRNRFEFKKR